MASAPKQLIHGRQLPIDVDARKDFHFSVSFRLWTLRGSADFAELGSVVSEIEQTEYMEAGPFGRYFSRHPGRFKPPTVTLKRASRTGPSTTWLWMWHQSARVSPTVAKADAWLSIYGRGEGTEGMASATYGLLGAWPSRMELTGAKAGGTEIVLQTVTLQCDELVDMSMI